MTKRYFYSKLGKRISKKEYQRRKNISSALKKYHALKTDLFEKQILEQFEKLVDIDDTYIKTITTKRKSTKKKPKPKPKKYSGKITTECVHKKVKTFPRKKDKKKFFITNKKVFNLNPPIDILSENDFFQIENVIEIITPKIIKFYQRYKIKNKRQRLNLGYMIYLAFESKDGQDITDFQTVSFLPSFIVKNKKSIIKSFESILELITDRFVGDPKQAYIYKSGFKHLTLFGFEAEIETL